MRECTWPKSLRWARICCASTRKTFSTSRPSRCDAERCSAPRCRCEARALLLGVRRREPRPALRCAAGEWRTASTAERIPLPGVVGAPSSLPLLESKRRAASASGEREGGSRDCAAARAPSPPWAWRSRSSWASRVPVSDSSSPTAPAPCQMQQQEESPVSCRLRTKMKSGERAVLGSRQMFVKKKEDEGHAPCSCATSWCSGDTLCRDASP